MFLIRLLLQNEVTMHPARWRCETTEQKNQDIAKAQQGGPEMPHHDFVRKKKIGFCGKNQENKNTRNELHGALPLQHLQSPTMCGEGLARSQGDANLNPWCTRPRQCLYPWRLQRRLRTASCGSWQAQHTSPLRFGRGFSFANARHHAGIGRLGRPRP